MKISSLIVSGRNEQATQKIIQIDLSDRESEILLKKAEKRKRIYVKNEHFMNRSELDGSGTIWGTIGEYIVLEYLKRKKMKASFPKEPSVDYDLCLENLKLEVKSKRCQGVPCADYEGSTPSYYQQKCDYYVFTRIKKDWRQAWIVGCINKDDFIEKRELQKGGETRGDNNVYYGSDSFVLPYYKCDNISVLLKRIKEETA